MLDLIEQLEKAEAGSRELDAEICATLKYLPDGIDTSIFLPEVAISYRTDHGERVEIWSKLGRDEMFQCSRPAQPVTTSLDAIVALIGEKLPGQFWAVSEHPDGFVATIGGPFHSQVKGVTLTTAPLALAIALLRAIQTKESGHG